MSSTRSPLRRAPATDCGRSAATLVLCGHGTRGTGGLLDRHAASIRARNLYADVRVCSLYGTPDLTEVLDGTASPQVCVVPWLMCAGFTMDRLRAVIDGHRASGRIVLAGPVGAQTKIADLAAKVAVDACRRRKWSCAETGLLLIGHGSERNAVSAETTRGHAAHIAAEQEFAAVATAFLDEAPSPAEALGHLDLPHRIAVGLFAERSLHGEDDVPRLLSAAPDIVYTGPIGTMSNFADILVAQAREALPFWPRSAA